MSSSTCFCRSVIAMSVTMASRTALRLAGLEDPGLHVEHLGGHPQRLGDLVEYLGRGFA